MDRDRSVYVHLPFDVPPGIQAVRVSLDHDPRGKVDALTGGAVLDLGLIGPGSLEMGTPAFRGWSGSERQSVFVGATRATPGYRPGPIDAGRWHVLLGLYRIPAAGCTYQVDIESLASEPEGRADPGGAPPSARTRRRAKPTAPGSSGASWIACDLHAHTIHSDGEDEIAAVANLAADAGLQVLFVTDHNTDSHHPYLTAAGAAAGLSLLPGEEVTTYGGHLNALGTRSWVDFRHTTSDEVRAAIDAIHAQGGLASVNHPASDGSPWAYDPGLPFDLVEVWNGPWRPENEQALAWWAGLLRAGRRVTAVGGSDMHSRVPRGQPVGTPVTWVGASTTDRDAVVGGLLAGRAGITRDVSVRPPRLSVVDEGGGRIDVGDSVGAAGAVEVQWQAHAHAGWQLRLISSGGPVTSRRLDAGHVQGRVMLDPAERAAAGLVRLEIRDDDALVAMTNPVFLEAV